MRSKRREHVCPLLPESGQLADGLGMSALCQKRTYAAQQKAPLFDHLVGELLELQRDLQTELLRGFEIDH
jgi:hypothetical protein